jgi:hypothetical protein
MKPEKSLQSRITRLRRILKDRPWNAQREGQLMEAERELAEMLRVHAALERARDIRMADAYLAHIASRRRR